MLHLTVLPICFWTDLLSPCLIDPGCCSCRLENGGRPEGCHHQSSRPACRGPEGEHLYSKRWHIPPFEKVAADCRAFTCTPSWSSDRSILCWHAACYQGLAGLSAIGKAQPRAGTLQGRLHLELRKMLLRGAAHSNVMLLWRLKLLDLLLPTYACWLQVAHVPRRAGPTLPHCFSLLQALDKAVPQGMEAPAEVVLALLAAPVLAQVMLANHAEIEQALQQRDEQPSDSSTGTQPAERAGASKRKRSSRKAAQAGPGKPGSCETASKPSEGRDVPLADILATGLRLFRELDPQVSVHTAATSMLVLLAL